MKQEILLALSIIEVRAYINEELNKKSIIPHIADNVEVFKKIVSKNKNLLVIVDTRFCEIECIEELSEIIGEDLVIINYNNVKDIKIKNSLFLNNYQFKIWFENYLKKL